jgi:hypothetical protein
MANILNVATEGYFHVSTQSHLQIAHFPPNTQFSPYYRAIFSVKWKLKKYKKPHSIFFRKMSHLTTDKSSRVTGSWEIRAKKH